MARRPRLSLVPPLTSWEPLLLRERQGGPPFANLANVLIVLHNDPELYRCATFDEMRQHSMVATVWPAAPDADPVQPPGREVNDDDVGRMQQWLQHMGLPRVGRETVGQAIEIYAREHRYHPVRDVIDYLEWDGVPRIDKWLFTYFGAKAETDDEIEYVRLVGAKFLIAMIARVYRPGCQCDYMLVLEGEQGALKSSACRILAGEWFSDSLPENIASKDARLHLAGKWLIEISELASVRRADVETLKNYITRREERFRPPYGRHDVVQPRQCVFVGTTNEQTWIKDQTGGRRFWPVVCLHIDLAALEADRNQLLAEAAIRFRDGERWWPTPAEEANFFKPQQELRRDDDVWAPQVRDYLENSFLGLQITIGQIARDGLHITDNSRVGNVETTRLRAILKDLGWTFHRTEKGRYYKRPTVEHDAE
jgi:predicted P-loop ATPase